jgi:hypothetical protein
MSCLALAGSVAAAIAVQCLIALELLHDLFKKSEKPIDTLETWPDDRRQLAAYRLGLNRQDARYAIVYVQLQEPKARVIELGQDELEKGEREFLLGLNRQDARCAIVYVQLQEPKARVIELGQDELENEESSRFSNPLSYPGRESP